MSASVIPVVGRFGTAEAALSGPAAHSVSLPAAPWGHIRAEEADHEEQLSRACSVTEDSLIFPALVCS